MADLLARAQAALAGRFRVERELGRGGMATVFLAEDLKHNRLLAVKILHPDLAAAIGPEKFRSEIDFAAHLNHPHILPLIDSGEDAGLLWYAMPYVEGETLRERMQREGKLPLGDVADLAQQVASAMDYAHGLGILHRDIKPENLLLAHGHVWVADFGIAKALKQSAEASGAFEAGTPGYMSPEQMAGEPLDRRADVFSLGAVVYECLTGRRPFPDFERRKDLFGRHRKPGRISLARPEVPPRLEATVRRALAPMPSERQATAGEFAQAVTKAVTDPQMEKVARSGWLRGGLVTFTVFAAAVVAYSWFTRPPEYDDNRVVILPVQGPGGGSPAWGQDLAVALEAQLNSTRSLVARSDLGDSAVRATASALDSVAARLAERQRARFSIRPRVEAGGSLLVTLWDHENNLQVEEAFRVPDGKGVFARATEIATAFLPRLLPTGGQIDQSVFGGSSVEALAAFLQGERAYRAGSFHRADTLFTTAARLDPAFTWAALRGAQAASWVTEHGRALTLIQLALERTDSLGERYVAFARGLEDYQRGEADSAIVHLREAIRLDSLWAEAHMALAEVYHHYLPMEGAPLDSAQAHFELAREYDPTFAPPLLHLLQLAVWRQDRSTADSLVALFERSDSQEGERVVANLMLACLRGEVTAERWQRAMGETMGSTASAAAWLAVGGLRQAECAEEGLRAVPSDPALARGYESYAPTVLAHVLAARGDSAGVRQVLDSAPAMPAFARSYTAVAIEAAGVPIGRDLVDREAVATLERVHSPADTISVRRIHNRWLLGVLALARGDLAAARDWRDSLFLLRVRDSLAAERELFLTSLDSRLQLAVGDTSLALALLERLAPGVKQVQLRWNPWYAFPHERMLRVRIYEARGETRRAEELAASFDSPASYGLLLYLPESLRRREALAVRLGKVENSEKLAARLAQLQRGRHR